MFSDQRSANETLIFLMKDGEQVFDQVNLIYYI